MTCEYLIFTFFSPNYNWLQDAQVPYRDSQTFNLGLPYLVWLFFTLRCSVWFDTVYIQLNDPLSCTLPLIKILSGKLMVDVFSLRLHILLMLAASFKQTAHYLFTLSITSSANSVYFSASVLPVRLTHPA